MPGRPERFQSIRRQAPSIFDSRLGSRTLSSSPPDSAGERSPTCRTHGDGSPPHQPATSVRADPHLVSSPGFVPIPVTACPAGPISGKDLRGPPRNAAPSRQFHRSDGAWMDDGIPAWAPGDPYESRARISAGNHGRHVAAFGVRGLGRSSDGMGHAFHAPRHPGCPSDALRATVSG